MPKLFTVVVTSTPAPVEKTVNVVAETAEEATAKVVVAEGETVVGATEAGEVVV